MYPIYADVELNVTLDDPSLVLSAYAMFKTSRVLPMLSSSSSDSPKKVRSPSSLPHHRPETDTSPDCSKNLPRCDNTPRCKI